MMQYEGIKYPRNDPQLKSGKTNKMKMLTNVYKRFSAKRLIAILSLSSLLLVVGCTTVSTTQPAITPFQPPIISSSGTLMQHPDFEKVVTASPEWVKLALQTINRLEREKLGRLYPETE